MSTAMYELTEGEMAAISGGDWVGNTFMTVGSALVSQGMVNTNNGSFLVTASLGGNNVYPVGTTLQFNGTWIVGAYQISVGMQLYGAGALWNFFARYRS